MRNTFLLLLLFLAISCGRHAGNDSGERIITVSIAPFKYFVEAIGGSDFKVNVMVPPGSDPHVYEPFPDQIRKLSTSEAYVSNGFLGFEMTWLNRFYTTNPGMKKLNLGEKIEPISSEEHHGNGHVEGADPHYWVSPVSARSIASSVKDLLEGLNPAHTSGYEVNYSALVSRIDSLDAAARKLFADDKGRSFMIYHPNLAYLARDYGLHEVAVEFNGKEPPPSRMKYLIDLAGEDSIKYIFIQREFDIKNAREIARETGAELAIIDPLSEDWLKATSDIINALKKSFN